MIEARTTFKLVSIKECTWKWKGDTVIEMEFIPPGTEQHNFNTTPLIIRTTSTAFSGATVGQLYDLVFKPIESEKQ
jgi:hypothetical protein